MSSGMRWLIPLSYLLQHAHLSTLSCLKGTIRTQSGRASAGPPNCPHPAPKLCSTRPLYDSTSTVVSSGGLISGRGVLRQGHSFHILPFSPRIGGCHSDGNAIPLVSNFASLCARRGRYYIMSRRRWFRGRGFSRCFSGLSDRLLKISTPPKRERRHGGDAWAVG
jgi:hypothetical protein